MTTTPPQQQQQNKPWSELDLQALQIYSLRLKELKVKAEELGISSGGNVGVLRERLLKYYEAKSGIPLTERRLNVIRKASTWDGRLRTRKSFVTLMSNSDTPSTLWEEDNVEDNSKMEVSASLQDNPFEEKRLFQYQQQPNYYHHHQQQHQNNKEVEKKTPQSFRVFLLFLFLEICMLSENCLPWNLDISFSFPWFDLIVNFPNVTLLLTPPIYTAFLAYAVMVVLIPTVVAYYFNPTRFHGVVSLFTLGVMRLAMVWYFTQTMFEEDFFNVFNHLSEKFVIMTAVVAMVLEMFELAFSRSSTSATRQ